MDISSITPVGDNILVEIVKEEEVTESGIIVTEQTDKTFAKRIGLVLAVSPDLKPDKDTSVVVNVGDRVLLQSNGGSRLWDTQKEYSILPAKFVLAVL